MMARKYIKPIMRNISDISITSGSCLSGSGELQVKGTCLSGGAAINTCTVGSNVLPETLCTPGGLAGFSCVSGSNAG